MFFFLRLAILITVALQEGQVGFSWVGRRVRLDPDEIHAGRLERPLQAFGAIPLQQPLARPLPEPLARPLRLSH